MIFRQIHEEGLAQMSYLLGCAATGEALVVDPRRDVDVYLELAQSLGLRITAIAETIDVELASKRRYNPGLKLLG